MANTPAPTSTVDEELLNLRNELGSMWTGSRMLIGAVTFLFGAFVFAYFYLKSVNSHGLWRPNGERPSIFLGTTIMGLVVGSAFVHDVSHLRLRAGQLLDWQVGAAVSVLAGLVAIGLQVWELTRLPFHPGNGGYASVFVGWAPASIVVTLGSLYWLETLIARSLRIGPTMLADGGLSQSALPDAQTFRASLDAFSYFWNYIALMSVLFWFLFYIL